jgi:GNAT superfamily N-acetyltransferase
MKQVIAGEPEPWGRAGEALRWREKTHNVGLRDEEGDLLALAGLVLAEVRAGDATLEVAGIGGVIVTRVARGRGLARALIERLLQIAQELGVQRAMLFCVPANVGLYARFGFQLIEEPVFAQQPGGLVEVPMRAMFKPLTSSARWPVGRVEVLGEPF